MTPLLSDRQNLVIRPVRYRDLEAVERLLIQAFEEDFNHRSTGIEDQLERIRQWYAPLKLLSFFPNKFQHFFRAYVAEQGDQILGVIQVSPFNCTRSTWRVDHVAVDVAARGQGIGSQLLRYCFETIWEARTWLLEININNKAALSLYRQNGFQPLAQLTYWSVAPAQLQTLGQREASLPNLLPVSNAEAALLYQLDTAAMPPLVRQVFDRHMNDFKTGVFSAIFRNLRQWINHTEMVSGYVFEPQRKAAIGYFQIQLDHQGNQPHVAQLMVHPAYTWLYPELFTQMASLTQGLPEVPLHLSSADYQPEREAYLEQIGAERIDHTLMMSRSVWHKLRESRSISLEGLQLSEVLQGFQPNRTPIPGRMSLLKPIKQHSQPHPQQQFSAKPAKALGFERSPAIRPWKQGGVNQPLSDHDIDPC